jgi:1-deoxyxylulose-5-phosphate synthase
VLEDTSRRKFFKRALGVAGATSSTLLERHPVFAGVASPPRRKAVSDQVTLGKTGIRLSRLAMGSGTRGFNKTSVQARLGVQGFADILVHAFDQGVNFFETADQYGTHEHMREGMSNSSDKTLGSRHAQNALRRWSRSKKKSPCCIPVDTFRAAT